MADCSLKTNLFLKPEIMRIPSKQLGPGDTCYTQRNKDNDERKFITGNNEMRRQQNISKILKVNKQTKTNKKTCLPRIPNPVKYHPKTEVK